MRVLVYWLLIATAGWSAHSEATPLCEYEEFSPNRVMQNVLDELVYLELAPVLPRELATPQLRQYRVFRDHNLQVGNIEYLHDFLSQERILNFYDVEGTMLLKVVETVSACPAGRPTATCYQTRFFSAFEQGLDAEVPAFTIRDGDRGLEWLRYRQHQNPVIWRDEVRTTLQWVANYFAAAEHTRSVRTDSPLAAVQVAILSDALLAPYANSVTFVRNTGEWVVSGRLPSNAHYYQLLEILWASGLDIVRTDIVIDTGYVGPMEYMQPIVEECL